MPKQNATAAMQPAMQTLKSSKPANNAKKQSSYQQCKNSSISIQQYKSSYPATKVKVDTQPTTRKQSVLSRECLTCIAISYSGR